MNLDFMAKNEPYKENQVEWKDISYGWFYGTSLKKNGCGVIAPRVQTLLQNYYVV